MADQPFGETYASHYDLMYGQKNYQAECDMLEGLFERYSSMQVRSILDLGCGTGNHAFPLADRGYQVTGVDRSPQMLRAARSKLDGADNPDFRRSEIQQLKLDRQFHAVLMMFAVMGYLASDDALSRGLQVVRQHLGHGGLFVGDFWYGPAVEAIGPSVRTSELDTGQAVLQRKAIPELDVANQRCTVRYQLSDPSGVVQAEEAHTMRYFFPDELSERLAQAGLQLLALHPFPELEGEPDETTWNALMCARAA